MVDFQQSAHSLAYRVQYLFHNLNYNDNFNKGRLLMKIKYLLIQALRTAHICLSNNGNYFNRKLN